MAELTPEQIQNLLAGANTKRSGPRKDPTEPRTIDNWWKQHHHFININDTGVTCQNVNCLDPEEGKRSKILIELKGRMCCRYCFLDGWLSGKEYD